MISKRPFFFTLVCIFFFGFAKSQNEFITTWMPNNGNAAIVGLPFSDSHSIWFPGIGTDYTIYWEEVGHPQNNGTLTNVTSTENVFIDFGSTANTSDPTYFVKVSDGNGHFDAFRMANVSSTNGVISALVKGDNMKLMAINNWGNKSWSSLNGAFAMAKNLVYDTTSIPNLSNTLDLSYMFYNIPLIIGNQTISNWNTSAVQNFEGILAKDNSFPENVLDFDVNNWNISNATNLSRFFRDRKLFNSALDNWDTSNVKNMSHMFEGCGTFNQALDSWDTGEVTNMEYMFSSTVDFNQNINNWDTSKVTNMRFMFHINPNYNQPVNNWDVSQVTDFSHMFHVCASFNQPLDNWDTSSAVDMSVMLQAAMVFNQNLGTWNLPSLELANLMISMTGISCSNYSSTLVGWASNPNTANNIALGNVAPLTYASSVSSFRDALLTKGWTMNGDSNGECEYMGVSESFIQEGIKISPNPATDYINITSKHNIEQVKIYDYAGRLVLVEKNTNSRIDISTLKTGIYFIEVKTKRGEATNKFIKK